MHFWRELEKALWIKWYSNDASKTKSEKDFSRPGDKKREFLVKEQL